MDIYDIYSGEPYIIFSNVKKNVIFLNDRNGICRKSSNMTRNLI